MKMQQIITTLLVYLGCSLACAATVQATTFAQHSGASDPTTEGWSTDQFGVSGLSLPDTFAVVADLGTTDAWAVDDNTANPHQLGGYSVALSAAQVTAAATEGWEMTVNVRLLDLSNPGGAMNFGYFDGTDRWLADFDLDGSGNVTVSVFGTSGSFTTSGDTSVYHAYKMVFDPISGTADLLVDGVEQLSDFPGQSNTLSSRVMFGSLGGSRTAQGNWADVTFATTAVPEPSTLLLALGGVFGASFYSRRRS